VLTHRIHGKAEGLPEVFTRLKQVAGDAAAGIPVVVLHHPLTDEKGITMDVCLPLTKLVDCSDFEMMTLEGGIAAIALHKGPYEERMNAYRELIPNVYKHGHPIQENGREAFPNLDLENPENTVVELQVMIIDWDNRLDQHLERVLGAEKKRLCSWRIQKILCAFVIQMCLVK